MKRKVWQGDVLRFIRRHVSGTRNLDFQYLSEEITSASLAPARISEIINVSRSGHIGRPEFDGREALFYDRFFAGKDLAVISGKLKGFVEEEKLDFPSPLGTEEDTDETYILRFLRYGLSNLYTPDTEDRREEADASGPLSGISGDQSGPAPEPVFNAVPEREDREEDNTEASVLASGERSLAAVVRQNWFVLFLLAFFFLVSSMYLFASGISLTELFLGLFHLPLPVFAPLALLLAILPKAAGLWEASAAYRRYKKQSEGPGSFWAIAKFGAEDAVVPGRGVFDAGQINMQYGLFSNLTGALCTIAFYLHASELEGFSSFVASHPADVFLFLLILASAAISICWDFLMQMRPLPAETGSISENPSNYLMGRLHVLATMLHLMLTLVFDGAMILYLLWQGYEERFSRPVLSYSFIFVICTIAFYLWFASVSPHARALKVDCGWLIHMMPVMSAITMYYIFRDFALSPSSAVCLAADLLCLFVWSRYLPAGRNAVQGT